MLKGWSNFLITIGEAGSTLVGLFFPVFTLGTGLPTSRKMDITHASLTRESTSFASVLGQSMIVLVPWQSTMPGGVIFGVLGV